MTVPLWTAKAAAKATGGQTSGDWSATGLSIDTRSIIPGDMFIALKDARDGHDFVTAAFAAGASAALVSREIPDAGGPQLLVDDVQAALEALGNAARKRADDAVRVAVTGSVGKTSVKEMLAQMFRAAGPAHWSIKSFNNHWGVPLTLARMPQDTRHAVFEIGMSTPGEIAPRSKMVAPHVAMITKIAPAHLEGVGSILGVANEKSDISAGLQSGGALLLPKDDAHFDHLVKKGKEIAPHGIILTFGRTAGSFARVLDYSTDGTTSIIAVELMGETVRVRINAVGEHWAQNVAAALLAACVRSSISPSRAAEALHGYAPPPGRGTSETLTLPGDRKITLIDEAYNANPASMRAALAGFAARPCSGKRVIALGEMLEIGAGSAAEHAALKAPIEASGATVVLGAGAAMEPLISSLPGTIRAHHAVKAEMLNETLKNLLEDGDLLLLKGSNASGMGKLADHLRQYSIGGSEQVMDAARSAARGNDAV